MSYKFLRCELGATLPHPSLIDGPQVYVNIILETRTWRENEGNLL